MDNITPRDLFAAAALQGMLSFDSEDGNWGDDHQKLSERAFVFADAMMKRRNKESLRVKKEEAQWLHARNMAEWKPLLSILKAPMLVTLWCRAAYAELGMSQATFYRYLEGMVNANLVWMNPADGNYQKTKTK
jgi:hypothetical protein